MYCAWWPCSRLTIYQVPTRNAAEYAEQVRLSQEGCRLNGRRGRRYHRAGEASRFRVKHVDPNFASSDGQSHVFNGKSVDRNVGNYQLCDITDTYLANLISNDDYVLDECHVSPISVSSVVY